MHKGIITLAASQIITNHLIINIFLVCILYALSVSKTRSNYASTLRVQGDSFMLSGDKNDLVIEIFMLIKCVF